MSGCNDDCDCPAGMPPLRAYDEIVDEGEMSSETNLSPVTPYPNNPAEVPSDALDKLECDTTLYEQVTSTRGSGDLPYRKFFGCNVITQYIGKPMALTANVFRYGIYVLQQDKVFNVFSFSTGAAQAPMPISINKEILVVKKGTFVLEKNVPNPTNDDRVILDINSYDDGSYSFEFIGVSYAITNGFTNLVEKTAKEHNFYKGKVFSNSGKFLDVSKMTLDDVVLPQAIKKEIQENVVDFVKYKMPLLRKHGLPTKRGVIFEGIPGTGKSFTGRALAASIGVTFIVINGVNHDYIIRNIYQFARKVTPVIILFEDIDIYLFDRDSGDGKLSILLNEMDGMEENRDLVTILTTNKIGVLDTAIKDRPGRFDRILKFTPPDAELSKYMLKLFSEKFDMTDVDFDYVVQELKEKQYTGAHYKEIIITACMRIINKDTKEIKLTTQDLLDASKTLQASSTKGQERPVGFSSERGKK